MSTLTRLSSFQILLGLLLGAAQHIDQVVKPVGPKSATTSTTLQKLESVWTHLVFSAILLFSASNLFSLAAHTVFLLR